MLPGLADLLAHCRGSAAATLEVATALTALESGVGSEASMTSLTFGAHAASVAEDHASARALMDTAMAADEDPQDTLAWAGHLAMLGRTADTIELLEAHVDHPAYDAAAAAAHRESLGDAARHAGEDPRQGACACGSGRAWSECCRAREAAALARFADRTGLYALRTALAEFLPGSAYEKAFAHHVGDWLDVAEDPGEDGMREPLERLAVEHAWLAATSAGADVPYGDLDDGLDDTDDDTDNILTALAEDPATPADVAERARAWLGHVRYGLWQVAEPAEEPGLWCTEVCTGQKLYVAFAPEQREGIPRWAVLLGAVVPIDGAWRAAGAMIQVSPSEADALCETIGLTTEVFVTDLVGRRGGRQSGRNAARQAGRPTSRRRSAGRSRTPCTPATRIRPSPCWPS